MEDSRDDIILDESEDAPITCNSMGCHKLMPDSNTSPEFQLSPPHLRFEKVLERMKKRPDGSERKHFRPEEVRSKRIRSLAESKSVSSSKVIDLPIKNIYLSLQRNFIANQAYSNRQKSHQGLVSRSQASEKSRKLESPQSSVLEREKENSLDLKSIISLLKSKSSVRGDPRANCGKLSQLLSEKIRYHKQVITPSIRS